MTKVEDTTLNDSANADFLTNGNDPLKNSIPNPSILNNECDDTINTDDATQDQDKDSTSCSLPKNTVDTSCDNHVPVISQHNQIEAVFSELQSVQNSETEDYSCLQSNLQCLDISNEQKSDASV